MPVAALPPVSAPSIGDGEFFTALRNFLLAFSPPDFEVIQGQGNRVPEPDGPNFIVMTPLFRPRLRTNISTYTDNPDNPALSAQRIEQGTKVTIQLDFHGPGSPDAVQVIATVFRDQAGCDALAASGFEIQPLYCEDPKQMPFIDGEQQYEERWTLDVHLQFNPFVTIPQAFAEVATVGVIDVMAVYPVA